MPERETIERAREDARDGKSPSTQAGEFVREEMHHIREGKHGASSPKQAIAIGLSKARRAGVPLQPPAEGKTSAKTRKQASRESARAESGTGRETSAKRSRATRSALKKKGRSAASHSALSKQARSTAKKRGSAARRRSAMKAVATRKRKPAASTRTSSRNNSSRSGRAT
jgi:hypothetical protein